MEVRVIYPCVCVRQINRKLYKNTVTDPCYSHTLVIVIKWVKYMPRIIHVDRGNHKGYEEVLYSTSRVRILVYVDSFEATQQ